MLTNAFKVLINNPVKESFYKKKINVLTTFFISHKSYNKTFLKWMVNQCPKDTLLTFYLNKYYLYLIHVSSYHEMWTP